MCAEHTIVSLLSSSWLQKLTFLECCKRYFLYYLNKSFLWHTGEYITMSIWGSKYYVSFQHLTINGRTSWKPRLISEPRLLSIMTSPNFQQFLGFSNLFTAESSVISLNKAPLTSSFMFIPPQNFVLTLRMVLTSHYISEPW